MWISLLARTAGESAFIVPTYADPNADNVIENLDTTLRSAKSLPIWTMLNAESATRVRRIHLYDGTITDCCLAGHFAKDCPDGGSRACRNCGQEGHISKDCDQPKNMDSVVCRNCDETGHFSKECPKPRDCKFRGEALVPL